LPINLLNHFYFCIGCVLILQWANMLEGDSKNDEDMIPINGQLERLRVTMPFSILQLVKQMNSTQVLQINSNKSSGMGWEIYVVKLVWISVWSHILFSSVIVLLLSVLCMVSHNYQNLGYCYKIYNII